MGQSQTKVRVRGKRISIKFGESEEDQKGAHRIMSAIREGELERRAGKPLYTQKDGTKIYRILLFGLHWKSDGKGTSCYRAVDGPRRVTSFGPGQASMVSYGRVWAVGKDVNNRWGVVLHDEREGSPHVIAEGCRTLRLAKTTAEEAARRMPEME